MWKRSACAAAAAAPEVLTLGIEEDLVNMMYEEYLQRHGQGHLRDCNGYPQEAGQLGYHNRGPGYRGWMGGGPIWLVEIFFILHQILNIQIFFLGVFCSCRYANYVASWYGLSPNKGGMHGVGHGYEVSDCCWRGSKKLKKV